MITDREIKGATTSVASGARKLVELTDPGERGGGRLCFSARKQKSRVSTEWYAVWTRARKRRRAKFGSYPTMPLAEARKVFREQYLPVILRGEDPVGPRALAARGGATVAALFEAYVASLGSRPYAKGARYMLLGENGVANAIGPNRPAAAVRASHILPHLAAIHERNAPVHANHVRNVIHAAFSYGIKSRFSYSQRASAVDWGLEFNPVSVIRKTAGVGGPRDRALKESELRSFWRWLEANRGANRSFDALRLMIATGQRPKEILELSANHYDREQQLLFWGKTKNGKAHCIPLPRQAVEILEQLQPDEEGLYFRRRQAPGERTRTYSAARLVRRYIEETGTTPFETRDLRRTWKTLAGAANIPKHVRDQLQNHALNDISSRHYDRWDYMPEKRDGMARWSDFLDDIIDPNTPTLEERPLAPDLVERLAHSCGGHLWRAAGQAGHHADWIGWPLADAFEMVRVGTWRLRVARLVADLLRRGILVRSVAKDEKHRDVPVVQLAAGYIAGQGGEAVMRESLGPRPSETMVERLRCALGTNSWRAAPQARRYDDWVGRPIAAAFGFAESEDWERRASRWAFSLAKQGVLVSKTMVEASGRVIPAYVFSEASFEGPMAAEKLSSATAGFGPKLSVAS